MLWSWSVQIVVRWKWRISLTDIIELTKRNITYKKKRDDINMLGRFYRRGMRDTLIVIVDIIGKLVKYLPNLCIYFP